MFFPQRCTVRLITRLTALQTSINEQNSENASLETMARLYSEQIIQMYKEVKSLPESKDKRCASSLLGTILLMDTQSGAKLYEALNINANKEFVHEIVEFSKNNKEERRQYTA